ncbi:regulator of complement activation group 2 gene 1 isoform X3 [Scomber japonicus]|uniref:regulator of complement activation group 2 gene 1 isoform X3 n=1 Tax=Scomber japonicus TaxID=13676 RepID=UPI002306A0A6|nr:regulator of complement activation group 2 gene 1 isoform X3 [Scomber japonicus]
MGVSYFLYLSCLGLAITAQVQDCTRPVGGPNTVLTDNRATYPTGTTVTFECETGYITAGGNPRITCTAGTWSPLSLKCERIEITTKPTPRTTSTTTTTKRPITTKKPTDPGTTPDPNNNGNHVVRNTLIVLGVTGAVMLVQHFGL